MSPKKVDFIIVGQGLAGSILAYQLIDRGKMVAVIDNNHHQSSSQVAAGIINPITGPRLALSADFTDYYNEAKCFYQSLQTKLNTSLWTDLSQQRLIQNDDQLRYYQKRQNDPGFAAYLGGSVRSNAFDQPKHVISIKQSAIVDSKNLLNAIHSWLGSQQRVTLEKLNYEQLEFNKSGVRFGNIQASKIIFCEGHQAIHNPWLKNLPFLLSKGEILTVKIEQPINDLLNWGNWLAPIGTQYKLGSNYQWDDLSPSPSQNIRQELLNSLRSNTKLEAEVASHEVGIRPTTKQRKPFIGPLSNRANAYCFNGFGSKGCLLIPHYAKLMSEALTTGAVLPKELTRWL